MPENRSDRVRQKKAYLWIQTQILITTLGRDGTMTHPGLLIISPSLVNSKEKLSNSMKK
jgi:hypothetical protein